MLTNMEVLDSFLEKRLSKIKISAVFNPSPYESYNCLIKLEKKLTYSSWKMIDLCIFDQKESEYVSIYSMYSDEVLHYIEEKALVSVALPQGA